MTNEDCINEMLRKIALLACKNPQSEWADKYGTDFENDTFMMHRYCWCEKEGCSWCDGESPNFLYKKTGFSVAWYKYIGRGMDIPDSVSAGDIAIMERDCLNSLAVRS